MANKEAKKTTSMIDQQARTQQAEHATDRSYIQAGQARSGAEAGGLRDEILGGYRNLASGRDVNGGAFSGSGGGGGYNAKLLGLDPSLVDLEGKYKNLSGGMDRALGGYDEFAKTGGVSDADRANIRSRGAETGSAIFGNLKNEMARRNAVSGGYGGGMSGSMARLAREQGIAAGKGARDTEMDISNTVRQGRLAGLSGQERIGGAGYAGASDVANTRQSVLAQNVDAQNQAAAHNSSISNSRSGDGLRAQMAGLGGLQDMYGATPSELARYDSMMMGERGMTDESAQGALGLRNRNVGQETSAFDRAMQVANAAGGIGQAFMPTRKAKPAQ